MNENDTLIIILSTRGNNVPDDVIIWFIRKVAIRHIYNKLRADPFFLFCGQKFDTYPTSALIKVHDFLNIVIRIMILFKITILINELCLFLSVNIALYQQLWNSRKTLISVEPIAETMKLTLAFWHYYFQVFARVYVITKWWLINIEG